jgi:hypothetical protein
MGIFFRRPRQSSMVVTGCRCQLCWSGACVGNTHSPQADKRCFVEYGQGLFYVTANIAVVPPSLLHCPMQDIFPQLHSAIGSNDGWIPSFGAVRCAVPQWPAPIHGGLKIFFRDFACVYVVLSDSRQSFPVIKDPWLFAPCSHLASVFRSSHVLYFQCIHRQVTFAYRCFVCPKKHGAHRISTSSYLDILLRLTNGVCRPGRGLRRMFLPSSLLHLTSCRRR